MENMALNKYQRKWVDELRNGGHRQGTGMLARAVDGWEYCCLGIAACKVFKADEERIGCHGVLSQANELADAEWKLGLTRPAQGQLASLNDEHGLTFAQIADVVERMASRGETPMKAARSLGYVEE